MADSWDPAKDEAAGESMQGLRRGRHYASSRPLAHHVGDDATLESTRTPGRRRACCILTDSLPRQERRNGKDIQPLNGNGLEAAGEFRSAEAI